MYMPDVSGQRVPSLPIVEMTIVMPSASRHVPSHAELIRLPSSFLSIHSERHDFYAASVLHAILHLVGPCILPSLNTKFTILLL